MSKHAKHRAEWRLFRYPLGEYKMIIQNRWYGFIKPRIRQAIKEYKRGR